MSNVDSIPFSPSGTFSCPFINLPFVAPLNPDGARDDRGAPFELGGVVGRWSNCRVYLDLPATFAAGDDVAFSRARNLGMSCFLAAMESTSADINAQAR